MRLVKNLCRIIVGIVFIYSGFVKGIDPLGSDYKFTDYFNAFGMGWMNATTLFFSFALSLVEFLIGIALLFNLWVSRMAWGSLLFMAFFTPLTLVLALTNPVSDCGCFGDAVVITNWETFFKNLVLSAAAIMVFMNCGKMFQCFTYKVYWFVALFSYFFCIGFAYWNYNHLPVMDFRPYKIGANIPSLMAIPDGAPEDEYKYTFVYEKDGVQKEFSLENYPQNDSTWTFVESKTELIKKGYEPPVASFNIYNAEGDDVTDEILHNPQPILLLIAPKLEKADDEQIDEINGVYDYALEYEMPFYCVTGSSPEMIDEWSDNTGAEYPFRMADEVLLKTIIRSNPGLVLLKDGTVMGKWHYNDIPDEEHVKAEIEDHLNLSETKEKEDGWLITILLTFTVPLLLVWVYDFFRFRRIRKEKAE